MTFPLAHLPLELALEILRLAASPTIHAQTGAPSALYAPACALAQVSFSVRQAVMPHLLHTVLFASQDALDAFARTLALQAAHAAARSRLRLDYPAHVRRVWATRCFEPLVGAPAGAWRSYGALYGVLARAETVGLGADALHLLHDAWGAHGGAGAGDLPGWACRRAVLAGAEMRWKPLVATAPGLRFLAQLTHFALWALMHDGISGEDPPAGALLPDWVQRVPFDYMPSLTHFACTLIPPSPTTATNILVYTLPTSLYGAQMGGSTFRKWVTSDNPLDYGVVCEREMNWSGSFDFRWETAFAAGEDNMMWTHTKQLTAS